MFNQKVISLLYLFLIRQCVSLLHKRNSTFKFSFGDLTKNEPIFLQANNISLIGISANNVAREIFSYVQRFVDKTSFLYSISQDLRIQRVKLLLESITEQYYGIYEGEKYFDLFQSREHEMAAIMSNFDSWDEEYDDGNNNIHRQVCIIGSDTRVHLLLTFLGFTSVQSVLYFSPKNASLTQQRYFTEDKLGHIDIAIHSLLLNNIVKRLFPGKMVGKVDLNLENTQEMLSTWMQYSTQCSVILLPTDFDVFYFGTESIGTLFHTIFSLSPSIEVPIIWISDFFHDKLYTRSGDVVCNLFTEHFSWYLQQSWARQSIFVRDLFDAEGFPYFRQQMYVSSLDDTCLQSSLYIGYYLTENNKQHISLNNVSEKSVNTDEILLVFTYQSRVYAETAEGLRQQLQQPYNKDSSRNDLYFPHILIFSELTLEIIEKNISSYLLQQFRGVSSNRLFHIVQVIMTPHFPASRVIDSFYYPLIDPVSQITIRIAKMSYVVVQYEQESFFRSFSLKFLGSLSLLNDARSVWVFSYKHREALFDTFITQKTLKHTTFQRNYYSDNRPTIFPSYFQPPNSIPVSSLTSSSFIDVVPVFAPCLPHMPCHNEFHPPVKTNYILSNYTLLFFGLCSQLRIHFLQGLHAALLNSPNRVALKQTCNIVNPKTQETYPTQLDMTGAQREKLLLNRFSLVLNIPTYNTSVLEMHRIMYLLGMGKCIISQRGQDAGLSSLSVLQGAVYFVDTVEEVMDVVQYLLTPTQDNNKNNNNNSSSSSVSTDVNSAEEWILSSHGVYGRLENCERHALQAYHIIHNTNSKSVAGHNMEHTGYCRNANVDISHNGEYDTALLLKKAMNNLRYRLNN